jgi:GTP cyclohydrolase I
MSHTAPALLADRRHALPDVQAEAPHHAIALGSVGVRGMRLPLALDTGTVIATIDAGVDVPATQRGAHMSRFRRAIDAVPAGLGLHAFATALVRELAARHDYARRIEVAVGASQAVGDLVLDATARAGTGERAVLEAGGDSITLRAMGSTVCPCSFAMSGDRYAHVQRAEIVLELWGPALGLAELHGLVASAFSAPVAMVLDRPAEKALVDRMFAHPRFVEDVAREAVAALRGARAGTHARLEARAFESIHPYDCYAAWEGRL